MVSSGVIGRLCCVACSHRHLTSHSRGPSLRDPRSRRDNRIYVASPRKIVFFFSFVIMINFVELASLLLFVVSCLSSMICRPLSVVCRSPRRRRRRRRRSLKLHRRPARPVFWRQNPMTTTRDAHVSSMLHSPGRAKK